MVMRIPRAGIVNQGSGTAGTAAAALGALECGSLVIKADAGNADVVWVGNGAVAVDFGYPLAAGESLSLYVGSEAAAYVVAEDTSQVYHWLALSRD